MKKKDTKLKYYTAAGILLLFLLAGAITIKAAGKDSGHLSEKQITIIEIKKGDTLWSIAKKYYSREFKSLNCYIEEIRLTNNLENDTIQYGNHLVIPYYKEGVVSARERVNITADGKRL